MPNIMIHEEVGNYISKKISINSYDFYLGLLAPDSPNLNGFAPKEERWNAHIRRQDLNEWREALISFYNQEKDNYNKDFLLGYCIHVLTDIVYDDFLYIKVREKILADNYSLENSHEIMSEDMRMYYFKEIEEIKKILSESNYAYTIRNISDKKMNEWKEKQISLFQNANTSRYFTNDIINDLNILVYRELMEFFNSINEEKKNKII